MQKNATEHNEGKAKTKNGEYDLEFSISRCNNVVLML